MPTFVPHDTRLVMRYPTSNAFSFNKVRNNSSHQGVMNLAKAIASIQDEQPTRVSVVITHQLF